MTTQLPTPSSTAIMIEAANNLLVGLLAFAGLVRSPGYEFFLWYSISKNVNILLKRMMIAKRATKRAAKKKIKTDFGKLNLVLMNIPDFILDQKEKEPLLHYFRVKDWENLGNLLGKKKELCDTILKGLNRVKMCRVCNFSPITNRVVIINSDHASVAQCKTHTNLGFVPWNEFYDPLQFREHSKTLDKGLKGYSLWLQEITRCLEGVIPIELIGIAIDYA